MTRRKPIITRKKHLRVRSLAIGVCCVFVSDVFTVLLDHVSHFPPK